MKNNQSSRWNTKKMYSNLSLCLSVDNGFSIFRNLTFSSRIFATAFAVQLTYKSQWNYEDYAWLTLSVNQAEQKFRQSHLKN